MEIRKGKMKCKGIEAGSGIKKRNLKERDGSGCREKDKGKGEEMK